MKGWKYHRGKWAQIDDALLWNDGDEWGQVLERAGYSSHALAGYGDLGDAKAIEVYEKHDGGGYLIAFSFSDTTEYAIVDDLPSLMDWLRDYSPFFLLHEVAWKVEELLDISGKAFRAWHKHDYGSVCPECDPDAWRRLQEIRQRRRR